MIHPALYNLHIFSYPRLRYPATYNPNCSLIDSRTILSYSFLFSLYNLQQSMLAPLSKLGSIMCRMVAINIFEYLFHLTCKHGDNTQNDFLDALYRAPPFRRQLIHGRIVTRRVQNRYANVSIRVYWCLFLVSRPPQEESLGAELTIGME